MRLRASSSCWSAKTIWRSAARSRLPSFFSTSLPQRFTMSFSACVSGRTASRASTSASMSVAPRSASIRPTTDQPLIAAGGAPAKDANRVQLIDDLRYSHQFRHRAERLASKIGVRSRHDYPAPATGERGHQRDDSFIHELGLVDCDDVRRRVDFLADL